MSDHGLDLEAIAARAGGHSIFAPSYSPTWLTCSGSLLPSIFADDTAGEDAAYGTVGHDLAERWLNAIRALHETADLGAKVTPIKELVDECEPRELIDTVQNIVQRPAKGDQPEISYDITRDEDMFAYVREYVEWCAALPGEHYIEQRVDFSDLTPIPNQGGTTDHTVCQPRKLTVSDLKMGKGVRVQAAYLDLMDSSALIEIDGRLQFNGNPQALLYAYGTFQEWDWLYHFETIVIRICQPRLGVFETWETTREELLKFAEYVRERALAAWVPDAPRTPSEKGCQWCKIRGDCPAIMAWTLSLHGDKMGDITVDDQGVINGVTYTVAEMTSAAEVFVSKASDDFNPRVPAAKLDTEALEKLMRWRKTVEKYFADVETELTSRALAGATLTYFKLATSRTNRKFVNDWSAIRAIRALGIDVDDLYKQTLVSPAQAEELVHAKLKVSKPQAVKMLAELVHQPRGRDTLAPFADPRKSVKAKTDVFDSVEIEDAL